MRLITTLTLAAVLAGAGGLAMADDMGMSSDSMSGDAMSGDAMSGDAMSGDAMSGDAMSGDHAMSDDAMQMTLMQPAMTGQMGDQMFLMDQHKMTLYTFDNDMHGMSECTGDCAVKWPPLTASSDAHLGKGYSLITRSDGTNQVAYKGHPLYLWAGDTQPGQMTGDGVGGVWHVARP